MLYEVITLALILFAGLARADKRIEFFATRFDSNLTVMRATGDVLVLYKDYYLSANEAVFDRNASTLELFGDIVAMQGADYFAMGDYARLNIAERNNFV